MRRIGCCWRKIPAAEVSPPVRKGKKFPEVLFFFKYDVFFYGRSERTRMHHYSSNETLLFSSVLLNLSLYLCSRAGTGLLTVTTKSLTHT